MGESSLRRRKEPIPMTEHQTMNTIIHAAVRRDLHRFDRALEQFPADSQSRAGELEKAWDNLSTQLHHHHTDEETIFWPALRSLGAAESLLTSLQEEHTSMVDALDSADAAMKRLTSEPSAEQVEAARAANGRLNAVVDEHLAHEERDLEPLLVAQSQTPQIKSAVKAVRKAHKGNAGTFFAWLLDGASADDVRGLRREVPPPVLFVISRMGGRRYARTVASVWS
jgi:hypothetical protein